MSHLSAEEFVDLIDDALPPPRRAHLESCAACRGEAGVLGVVLARSAAAADVPEPSPLFWDHLSARVREGIEAPPARSWRDWAGWRGAAWTAGLASLALASLIIFETAPRAPLPESPRPAAATTAPPVDGRSDRRSRRPGERRGLGARPQRRRPGRGRCGARRRNQHAARRRRADGSRIVGARTVGAGAPAAGRARTARSGA